MRAFHYRRCFSEGTVRRRKLGDPEQGLVGSKGVRRE